MLNNLYFKKPQTEFDIKKYFKSIPDKFSEVHLDIRDHLGDGVYLLKNGDYGAFYKISGLHDETLTNDELTEKLATLNKALKLVISGIPSHEKLSNTVVQIHLRQRKISESDLELSSVHPLKDEKINKLFREENNYSFSTRRIIKREFYLSIRYTTPHLNEQSLFDTVKTFLKKDINTNDYKNNFEKHLRLFKTELNNLKLAIKSDFLLYPADSHKYIEFIQGYFHDVENTYPVVDFETNIHEQIITPKIEHIHDPDNDSQSGILQTDNHFIKVFYVDQLPESYRYGQFRLFLDSIPMTDFDLSWNLSHGSSEFGTDLIAKEAWYSNKPTRLTEANELASFRENTSSQRPNVIQSIRLITYSLKSQYDGYLQSIAMDYLGSRIVKELQIPFHMFTSSLPLNCLASANKTKGGRCKKIRLEPAIAFCPIYDGPDRIHGSRNWISRQNTLTSFDLFAGHGNKMTACIGQTRAGKSVLVSNLLLEFMGRYPKGIVRVIDKKSSYQKLSDLVGGRVIKFSEENLKKTPYSPFSLDTWDEDDIESIFLLIKTALIQKNTGIEFLACHDEVLIESIKYAYNSHLKNINNAKSSDFKVDPHPIWNNILSEMPQVCENLASSGVKGVHKAKDDIANWSVNLYQTGQYGFLFSRHEAKTENTSKERFLTYDLDGITDDVLRQLASMMAFIKISRDLSKLPKQTPKLIIFEELGMLLHGEDDAQKLMDGFIKNVIKTCAKLNAQAISITNDVEDYTEKAAGKTIWANSSQKIFLPLGDLFEGVKREWSERFNEADLQIMNSLKKEFHEKRSQAYIYSDNEVSPYKGTVYLPLSPFMDALCTTSGPQVDLYDSLRKKGHDCLSALIEMAEAHPYGENL